MSLIDPTAIEVAFDPLHSRMRGVAVHGNTPFDTTIISRITDDLWVGGCEDGLVLPEEVRHVVSLYRWEKYTVQHQLDTSLTVTMYDSEVGFDESQVIAVADWVNSCRATGVTLVHCQAGLNRSNLIAATALVRSGMSPDDAVALLREKRSPAVLCNRTFESFVRNLANQENHR